MSPSLFFLCAALLRVAGGRELPVFEVDLDKPARQRWQHIAEHYRPWYEQNYKTADIQISADPWSDEEFDELAEGASIPEEIHEEIAGIVETLSIPAVTPRILVKRMMLYELGLTMGFDCSGIVAAMAGGNVIHGRNLDMGVEAFGSGVNRHGNLYTGADFKWADNITFEVVFLKGGLAIARGPTFFGSVGMHTGVHLRGGWSFEQNSRFELTENFGTEVSASKWKEKTLQAVKLGGKLSQLESRKIILEMPTFADAVDAFATAPWIAPQYYVIAGAESHAGVVVTVGRAALGGGFYDMNMLSEASGDWFIVQTNDDHWKNPLDTRRGYAISSMRRLQTSQTEFTKNDMMQVMRARPVCNGATVFTWVCTPATDEELFRRGDCDD
mmetsp:Transcript_16982/g.53360  ORF Transcript_16982/g.53360 Transcript_16982/m.53360 type:complete len:385 (-) Transcript_16982:76-1230(-)